MRAIAVDIDGTITDRERRLSLEAVRALRGAEEAGVPVIIVTGNILCFAMATSILMGTTGGVVAENGGVLYINDEVRVLGDMSKAERAYSHLKGIYPVRKVPFSDLRVSEIALTRDVPADTVREALSGFDVEVYDTGFAIHLTDPAVNKGSSMEILLESMGLGMDDVMAIGDSENDLEFIEHAGFRVAVANADPELKAIADYVTSAAHGEGVAEAVQRFLGV
ncbi:phosphoglycolate phosphatase [Methanothermobacter thermautotrophicus]|uniref:Phosphoglycolate phosphatase n=1 Tax=Methanothermobacter thermautotrophicus TaxID=145262 RepID=A0A842YPL9_METTF|nr:phosphoglycolate phosphatase [Methanothermobacter thermautotrophicus]MBE2900311.1 phosphoglycolate phosphatase [Methanothermobacter thermautotrophicus]